VSYTNALPLLRFRPFIFVQNRRTNKQQVAVTGGARSVMHTIDPIQNFTMSLLIFALLAILLFTVRVVHALYFSSLAHVPDPAINKVTELPLRILNARLQRNERIFEWHQKYRPVVVIAPGQVSFSSVPVAKEIYSVTAKHLKSSYFNSYCVVVYIDAKRCLYPCCAAQTQSSFF
jgi:hypothetical protein